MTIAAVRPTSSSSSSSSSPRPEPTAATKLAVAAGFALVIALCGGYAWWFLVGSQPHERTVAFERQPRMRPYGLGGGGGGPGPAAGIASVMSRLVATASPGVRPIRENEWFVKAGDYQLRVRGTGAAGSKVEATFQFATPATVFPPEQVATLRARAEILRDAGLATRLGLTDAQRKALAQADARADMVVSHADRARVVERWTAYAAVTDPAAKAEAEKPLIAALEDAGKRAVAPSKAALADRAKAIEAALTPEQWATYKQRGR